MAGTIIQIKKSAVSGRPTDGSLAAAEPAYSYVSDKLWIGTSDGSGVIAIGGKYFVDQLNVIQTIANSAFDAANSAGSSAAIGAANLQANIARTHANSAFAVANAAFDRANIANALAATVYAQANTARTTANLAWDTANTKFNSTGGTINGSVAVTGDLAVSGNITFYNTTTVNIGDPMLFLAANNRSADVVDIGFAGNYVNATGINVSTGFFRDAGTKEYYVFSGYDQNISQNNHIDITANGFSLAILNGIFRTSNLILGGANALSWLTTTMVQANTGRDHANAAFGAANTGQTIAVAAFGQANIAAANAVNASALNTGTVPSARISGSYTGITGVGVIAAGTWNGDLITVPYGGTARSTLTVNGVLYGNGVSAVNITAAGTDGQVLQATSTGAPVFAMLDGGSF